jgi:anti-sigma B factor antagonist/stage II sporulation protein AA (anti-sigma F factor antagonist)
MQLDAITLDGARVVRVSGAIDSGTSAEFERLLMEALGDGTGRIVLNLAAVEYVASAGLRVFLLAARKAKAAGGTLVMCHMPAPVKQVFQLSGFLKIITLVATEAEALSA